MIKTIKTFNAFRYKLIWRVTKRNKKGEIMDVKSTNKSILEYEVEKLNKDYIASDYCIEQLKKTEFAIDLMPVEYFIGEAK